jgi:hypothetical protein
VTTGGFGNFLVSTFELATSFVLSVLAVLVPILAGIVLFAIGCVMVRRVWRLKMRRAVAVPAKE